MIKKEPRGGARKGAGRPVTNPTRPLTVRLPIDRYEELKAAIIAFIKGENTLSR